MISGTRFDLPCTGSITKVVWKERAMDVLIPIIGITCIALLIYYIYILMRSDS